MDAMMAFCIAINANLVVQSCPLRKGQCYWQHKLTNKCCYTDAELSIEQFCERTGKDMPTDDQRLATINKLRRELAP